MGYLLHFVARYILRLRGSSRMYGFIQGHTTQPSNQLEVTSSIDEINNRFSTKPIERASITLRQVPMVDMG